MITHAKAILSYKIFHQFSSQNFADLNPLNLWRIEYFHPISQWTWPWHNRSALLRPVLDLKQLRFTSRGSNQADRGFKPFPEYLNCHRKIYQSQPFEIFETCFRWLPCLSSLFFAWNIKQSIFPEIYDDKSEHYFKLNCTSSNYLGISSFFLLWKMDCYFCIVNIYA